MGVRNRERGRSSSRMGIWDFFRPERELKIKWQKINKLATIRRIGVFHFGTEGSGRDGNAIRELGSKLFPYQELRGTVLVWHATCIRRGQKSSDSEK